MKMRNWVASAVFLISLASFNGKARSPAVVSFLEAQLCQLESNGSVKAQAAEGLSMLLQNYARKNMFHERYGVSKDGLLYELTNYIISERQAVHALDFKRIKKLLGSLNTDAGVFRGMHELAVSQQLETIFTPLLKGDYLSSESKRGPLAIKVEKVGDKEKDGWKNNYKVIFDGEGKVVGAEFKFKGLITLNEKISGTVETVVSIDLTKNSQTLGMFSDIGGKKASRGKEDFRSQYHETIGDYSSSFMFMDASKGKRVVMFTIPAAMRKRLNQKNCKLKKGKGHINSKDSRTNEDAKRQVPVGKRGGRR